MRLKNADFKFAREIRLCEYKDNQRTVQYWLIWQLTKVATWVWISLGFQKLQVKSITTNALIISLEWEKDDSEWSEQFKEKS